MAYGRSAECNRVYWLRADGTIPPHQHGRALSSCPGGGQPPTERCKRNGDPLAEPKPRLPRWALKYGAWSSLARLYQASAPLPDELISGIYSLPADKVGLRATIRAWCAELGSVVRADRGRPHMG
jgi:hypothetical protein